MSIEAMKMALEALIGLYETPEFAGTKDVSMDRLNRKRMAREAIKTLRQAIEQAEQAQPVAYFHVEHRTNACSEVCDAQEMKFKGNIL